MTTKSANGSEKADQKNGKKPIKVIRIDNISASVFKREAEVNGENQTFYSVGFSRSYYDKENKRQYVNSFNTEDLGKVSEVAEEAYLYIDKLKEPVAA